MVYVDTGYAREGPASLQRRSTRDPRHIEADADPDIAGPGPRRFGRAHGVSDQTTECRVQVDVTGRNHPRAVGRSRPMGGLQPRRHQDGPHNLRSGELNDSVEHLRHTIQIGISRCFARRRRMPSASPMLVGPRTTTLYCYAAIEVLRSRNFEMNVQRRLKTFRRLPPHGVSPEPCRLPALTPNLRRSPDRAPTSRVRRRPRQ